MNKVNNRFQVESPTRALVTGASRGIGYAVAEALLGAGIDVFLTALDKARLQQSVQRLQAAFPDRHLESQAADLSNPHQRQALASTVLAKQAPPVSILVNNAGRFVSDTLLGPDDQLEAQLATNVLSATQLSRLLLPQLIKQGRGDVFNVCSITSLEAYPNGASYCISKHALLGFSRALRDELKPHGWRVCAVIPGAVLTDSWEGTTLPPDRFIAAQDIAKAIVTTCLMTSGACIEELLIRPQQGDL